ncbi:MAP7 domain containing protein ensconsin isoform X2 [Arctopsyche grandis]|uniref:MAP7 domain containing protein ensconsin isoform X2 n=1 Tax=Arctopsyche grandis TaxID=121162 RepID=UPI00406D9B54
MRLRDTDRRLQVEERKRAIWEAERERREAIVRRNEEREARLEGRRRGNSSAGVFAFGSSTPRMLEPADTGGTFWGHRRATSTSNVMFAALPLSRRSSERELDPNKKRATSASGLDRQPGDEDGNADPMPWSRVARRRTDLVPTIPAPRDGGSRGSSAPRPPGRAYSMSRLDQLAQPRRPRPLVPPPPPPSSQPLPPTRPPRHRSMGNLAAAASHRSVGNLAIASSMGPSPPPRKHLKPSTPQAGSGLRSGEITPGSPSRPGSSMSSASTVGGTMTSSISGAITVNRRPRAAPRRPRPASIAGTGVTTPPHVKNNLSTDGKGIGIIGDKPPLPKVHTTGLANKKLPAAHQSTQSTTNAEKPQVPRRTHKPTPHKSPRTTPRVTPLQSPANDLPPSLQDVMEVSAQDLEEESNDSMIVAQTEIVKTITETIVDNDQNTTVVHKETTVEVTKEENGSIETQITTDVIKTTADDKDTETTHISNVIKKINEKPSNENNKDAKVQETIVEGIQNLTIANEAKISVSIKEEMKEKEVVQHHDLLDSTDMTGSMMARRITTEEEAKVALAERRRLAREEAERQAERERLRLEKVAAEELEKQRIEDERQRRLEEETIRLSELQRQAEEERLQQAILEAQKRAEEEKVQKETEARAKIEREAAEARAREEADKQRRETALRLQREEQEREARRKRVEAIMLRTRQSKQKKDDDKSPSEENKNIEDIEQQKATESNAENVDEQKTAESQMEVDKESAYEISVRQREEDLLNHMAHHNQTSPTSQPIAQTFAVKQELDIVTNNGRTPLQNGTPAPSNGSIEQLKDHSPVDNGISQSNNYTSQNGHSKNEINELSNFLNNSENQFNMALDNTVKQNIVTNNILDISDLDLLNTANSNNPFITGVNSNGNMSVQPHSDVNIASQIIDVSVDTITKNLINEDSINSNQPNNSPFITSFQDNQENRDVSLL